LRPELLARFNKKRKLGVDDSERPSKRQSLEPNGLLNGSGGGSKKSGVVSVDRSGGRLLLKMSFGKGKLEAK
jgi:transcription initiation factor TFIID subunit 2